MISFEAFTDNCAASGVELHKDFVTRLDLGEPVDCPDDWFEAVARAGRLLRADPALELTDTTVGTEIFNCAANDLTVEQVVLHGILNASKYRMGNASPGRSFRCANRKSLPGCSDAEGYFGQVVTAMADTSRLSDREGNVAQHGWSLVLDGREPIAIKKVAEAYGKPSALSLVELTVDGVPYPAGSLLRVDTREDLRHEQLFIPGDTVVSAGFLRLSAFALPPDERPEVFSETILNTLHNIRDAAAAKVVRDVPIEAVRMLAKTMVERAEL